MNYKKVWFFGILILVEFLWMEIYDPLQLGDPEIKGFFCTASTLVLLSF